MLPEGLQGRGATPADLRVCCIASGQHVALLLLCLSPSLASSLMRKALTGQLLCQRLVGPLQCSSILGALQLQACADEASDPAGLTIR